MQKIMMAGAMALAVALGGCATRESVEHAQATADAAEAHSGTAFGRANAAYDVGNNALGTARDAKSQAMIAEQKADQANADLSAVKEKVAYLDSKQQHKKKRHHRAVQEQPKSNS
jgi:formylmethanofuran dehydrogenase subunit E